MRNRGWRMIDLAGIAVAFAALPLSPAEARPTKSFSAGFGPTSAQQVRITVSVAPTFTPMIDRNEIDEASDRLCVKSNQDARTYDLFISGAGAQEYSAPSTVDARSNDLALACVSLTRFSGVGKGELGHSMLIISPR